MKSCRLQLSAISQKMPKIYIFDVSMKINNNNKAVAHMV